MINKEHTAWYIEQLTGSIDTVVEWRCIHDTNKGEQGKNIRGTLSDVYEQLVQYNANGWGIFCCINGMDGQGYELSNVHHIRAHVVDLDNTLTAPANYSRATADGASFVIQSSEGKYHVYWKVEPYAGNDFYTTIQRKLAQYYDGDKSIIDATRVMRVPGFMHQKGEPILVTAGQLSGAVYTHEQLEQQLSGVNVIEAAGGMRSPLGEPSMQAPSLDWLRLALVQTDPNTMDRGEWVKFSAAIKQAGWSHTDEETLFGIWSEWCDKYEDNDTGENRKMWNSFRDTEAGWGTIERKSTVKAYMTFKKDPTQMMAQLQTQPAPQQTALPAMQTGAIDTSDEILDAMQCQEWFKNCFFVEREGKIFSRSARFMNQTQFNGSYGGKIFIWNSQGKTTDTAWKAALHSTLWQVPKVDHVRFLPREEPFTIVEDALGRTGLNTYTPARVTFQEGDVSIWFDFMNRLLPNQDDQRMLFEYMAHNVKYPGYKIPWAPLIQSTEGVGKTVFIELMQHALGNVYTYLPKAQELVNSGSTFNAWMRNKLMIMVNEIKVGEKRDLIEVLKPMISDKEVEVQSKGVDQEMEDNPANWFFFSNFKDAIPISKNGRRYAIFYSAISNENDLIDAGMDDPYFDRLWSWLKTQGGYDAITHWLMNYPIEEGAITMRAPKTSSHEEAIKLSRSPIERIIADSVQDGVSGFRGGYVSVLAVIKRCRADRLRNVNIPAVQKCLENMGYVHLGRSPQAFPQEDITDRTELYGVQVGMDINGYGREQGYER